MQVQADVGMDEIVLGIEPGAAPALENWGMPQRAGVATGQPHIDHHAAHVQIIHTDATALGQQWYVGHR